jgi:hypothetical protein
MGFPNSSTILSIRFREESVLNKLILIPKRAKRITRNTYRIGKRFFDRRTRLRLKSREVSRRVKLSNAQKAKRITKTRYSYTIYVVRKPNRKHLPKWQIVNENLWTNKKRNMFKDTMDYRQRKLSDYYLPENYHDFERLEESKITRKLAKQLGIEDGEPHFSSEPLPQDDPSPDIKGQVSDVQKPKQEIPKDELIEVYL